MCEMTHICEMPCTTTSCQVGVCLPGVWHVSHVTHLTYVTWLTCVMSRYSVTWLTRLESRGVLLTNVWRDTHTWNASRMWNDSLMIYMTYPNRTTRAIAHRLQCVVVVYCSVLQCGAVCCSVLLQYDLPESNHTNYCSQTAACCCSVLQCVAVCRSVLQCVPAVWLTRIKPHELFLTDSSVLL